jgi:diguanylate cyclase (GGDEF)-like protein/PAS domain S-box-containing protein
MAPDPRACDRFFALVLTLVTAVATADALLGPPVVLIGLYAFAPLIAATRIGPRRVAGVALYAFVLALLGGQHNEIFGTVDHVVRGFLVAAAGAIAMAVALLRHRLESTRDALAEVVRQMPQGVVIVDARSGRVTMRNERAQAILGDAMADGTTPRGFHPDGRPVEASQWPLARSVRLGETVLDEEIHYERGDGTAATIQASSTPIRDARGEVRAAVATFRDVSDRRRADAERQALLVRERTARRSAEDKERRSAFLANAAALLASSLDWEATLSGVAMTAVPEWADWCAFALVGDDGVAGYTTIAHTDPAKEIVAWELERRWPTLADPRSVAARVLRTGQAEVVPRISDSAQEAYADGPEHLRLLRELDLDSALVAPLRVGGRVLGAMTLVRSDPERPLGFSELAFAEELAARCALAVDNAQREREAREIEERFRVLVESVEDYAIFMLDAEGRVTDWNSGTEGVMGHAGTAFEGRHVSFFFPPDDAAAGNAELELRLAAEHGSHEAEGQCRRADGTTFDAHSVTRPLYDERGGLRGFSRVTRDVTERKRLEAQLEHQAFHDTLTGLPNRKLLLDRVAQALVRAERREGSVALLFFDLDRFKLVNDSLGHAAGDALLVEAAERVRSAVRDEDTVARFGGDEFVVVCEQLGTRDDALLVAERIRRAFSLPFVVDGQEVFAGASVGVAFARPGQSRDSLMREADAAMYEAKQRGGADSVVWQEGMGEAGNAERLERDAGLRHAVERQELRLAYQPLVDLRSGSVGGVEALVRWQHPERGLLRPGDFIGIAEETGLIGPIGEWVLGEACEQVARWSADRPDSRPLTLTVAVNLSARQMAGPGLVEAVKHAIARTGIDPASLCLEITESQLVSDADATRTLLALKGLGVRLAIDDFGTGYSSLSYLKRLPVDTVKIDSSFVEGLGRRADDRAIVSAMIKMAHALGLSVVAEGVETQAQAEELRALGCDVGQGFLWAQPLPADGLEALLTDGSRRARAANEA